jgi:1,3-alpha-isomaltosidase
VIRHHPFGRGHPYVVDPDQRFPARPSAGAAFDLGITTGTGACGATLEVERGGVRRTYPMTCIGDAVPLEVGPPSADTVLPETGRVAWTFRHAGLEAGETIRYRFDGGAWFEVTAVAWREDGGTLHVVGDRGRLLPGVTWLTDGELVYAARFALPLEPGERVVGFGERFDGLDQRGKRLESVVFDQYKRQGARSYLPMPFAIVAGGGFGFHVDTSRRVRFDVGASEPDRIVVEVDLEPGEPSPSLTLRLYTGTPAEVQAAFLADTGAPAVPPDWVYRLWMSGNGWNTQQRVLDEVERSLAEEIAPGVVVIEAWSDEATFAAFDANRFPDPRGLVEALHERDVKVLLWQIPLAKREAADDVATMIEHGYCVRDADGEPYGNPGGWFKDALLLDVTNNEAVRWWTGRRRYLIDETGVDGFKTDGGEHAWSPGLRYADGTRGGETNNRYPVLYARAYHDLLRSSGREPVTFSRAGFTGAQLYPAHWAGDQDSTWEALRSVIGAGLTASACGISLWGFDLGGFSGPLPSPELYLRSAAVAALSPIMQYHAELGAPNRTPWSVAEHSGDEGVVATFREFVHVRERLVGYLAEQARRNVPLMRALFLVSGDERAWEFPYEYLLGEALLVAPVVEEGRTERDVFLPRGEWVDAASGDVLAGSRVARLSCPLDRLPVLVDARRADELVPVFQTPMEVR